MTAPVADVLWDEAVDLDVDLDAVVPCSCPGSSHGHGSHECPHPAIYLVLLPCPGCGLRAAAQACQRCLAEFLDLLRRVTAGVAVMVCHRCGSSADPTALRVWPL